MRRAPTRAAAVSVLFLTPVFFPLSHLTRSTATGLPDGPGNRPVWLAPNNLGAFVRELVDGRAVCREAGVEQAHRIRDRAPNVTVLESDTPPDQQGLRIILRGTQQLRGYPSATAAFKRAAARLEALIQTRVAIVIDVDFGPTLFGIPFENNVIGTTDAQVLQGNVLYQSVRAGLISQAIPPMRSSLLATLPANAVQTDLGASAGIAASSATLRALNLINQSADPDGELSSFGLPPAIGLNSKFGFDFEPADGISQDELDFEGIVLHEIGHVLGLISCVGQHEMNTSADNACSIWDLFRFRPDEINSGFAAAQRIVTPGGEQCFYAGDATLPLSTGLPNGTGGDGNQAAHWKDDGLTGRYLGVMDPTIGPGESHFLSDNDASVLEAVGYQARSLILVPLVSGLPQAGEMFSPPANLGFLSHLQYAIAVPPQAAQLRIVLNGNQDVDLFVRFGERVYIKGFHPVSDYVSAGQSGFESITITPSGSPPLRTGTYFIAVANYGPGEAEFTVTATVSAGVATHVPSIFNITPRLEGDVLDLTYASIDLDRDFANAELTILDAAQRPVTQPSSFVIGSDGSIRLESQLSIDGLTAVPTAMSAALVLIDREGNRSPQAIVGFSRAETGGLIVNGASFDGSRLTIKTSGLVENLQVEINGRTVAPPLATKMKGASGKLVVKGDARRLGLQPGPNRIRVRNPRGWSNIFILDT